MGYVATPPSFGHPEKVKVMKPLLNLSPCWGLPRRQGLCSHSAVFRATGEGRVEIATSDFVYLLGTPLDG